VTQPGYAAAPYSATPYASAPYAGAPAVQPTGMPPAPVLTTSSLASAPATVDPGAVLPPPAPPQAQPYDMIQAPPLQEYPPEYVAPGDSTPSPRDALPPSIPSGPPQLPPQMPPQELPLEPRPERPNAVSQMVNQSVPDSWNCGPTYGDACATGCEPECEPRCGPPWYALASYLMMGRNEANRLWTSHNASFEPDQIGNTQFGLAWRSGGEIRFGRRFCCALWAIEATYWTLDSMTGQASFTVPGGLVSTPLRVSEIEFGAGNNGVLYFDNAAEHRLWRRDEFHNVEINLLRRARSDNLDGTWNVEWSVGARVFRFEDDLRFGSRQNGWAWGSAGGVHEAYLSDDIKNNLVGFQFGFDARSNSWRRVQLFLTPQFGIYNNHIENTFRLYRGDGRVANPTPASLATGSYPVQSSKNVLSFLAEVDLGLDWQITPRWSARVGYRVLAATGIGFAEQQIPFYVVDIPEIRNIDYNGDLIVHGAFAGLTFCF